VDWVTSCCERLRNATADCDVDRRLSCRLRPPTDDRRPATASV
jgi:hypothetical protein